MDDTAARGWSELRHFAELGSTNTWLLEAAAAGAPEGMVVVADRQSAGRGRLGRRWTSPGGSGVLASVLFRPSWGGGELFCLSALVALAARDACRGVAGVSPGLKWPNDLVVDDEKIAGVLAETTGLGTPGFAVVVGIGINVSWPMPGDAPGLGATCLEAVARRPVSRDDLLAAFLGCLDERRPQLDRREAREALVAEAAACTTTLGRTVRVELAAETLLGTAVGLDALGHLLVETTDGRRTVAAGDVVHVR